MSDTKIKVSLSAVQKLDGTVVCDLECDGQEIEITFTGTDVITDVKEPADQD